MKKLYSTILATLFGASALMAQEAETTFAFMYKGEIVPNGGTVTISESTDKGWMFEMDAPIYVKNISEVASMLTISGSGKENFADIQFCPNGSCRTFPSDGSSLSTDYENDLQPNATVEEGKSWLHAEIIGATSYTGSVELKAYCTIDPEDCTTITVVFDTNATQGINKVNYDSRKMEVYNLCGKKIAESTFDLAKGIYIIKQNGTSRKVVIK